MKPQLRVVMYVTADELARIREEAARRRISLSRYAKERLTPSIQDEADSGENSEQSLPDYITNETALQFKRTIECEYTRRVHSGIQESGREAEEGTRNRDFIWKPKILEIQNRERNQQPKKNHLRKPVD